MKVVKRGNKRHFPFTVICPECGTEIVIESYDDLDFLTLNAQCPECGKYFDPDAAKKTSARKQDVDVDDEEDDDDAFPKADDVDPEAIFQRSKECAKVNAVEVKRMMDGVIHDVRKQIEDNEPGLRLAFSTTGDTFVIGMAEEGDTFGEIYVLKGGSVLVEFTEKE